MNVQDPKNRPHFSEICKVLDKLCDQYAPNIPIPAKNKNMGTLGNVADPALQNQVLSSVQNGTTKRGSGAVKKINATTFVKTLETPSSCWAVCVTKNRGMLFAFPLLPIPTLLPRPRPCGVTKNRSSSSFHLSPSMCFGT
jgi:hypothetical protein